MPRCVDCGFLWAHPSPDKAELWRLYQGGGYYARESEAPGSTGYEDFPATRFLKQIDHRRVALRLIQRAGCEPAHFTNARTRRDTPTERGVSNRPKLLDVGCAMGHFMDAAHDCGWEVEGVERNPDAIARLREKYRFPASHAEWPEFECGTYDAVAMLDVLEHLAHPFVSLSKAASSLRCGGSLVVTTPDHGSLPAKLLGKRNELVQKISSGEHLTLFTRKTLTAALNRAGVRRRRNRQLWAHARPRHRGQTRRRGPARLGRGHRGGREGAWSLQHWRPHRSWPQHDRLRDEARQSVDENSSLTRWSRPPAPATRGFSRPRGGRLGPAAQGVEVIEPTLRIPPLDRGRPARVPDMARLGVVRGEREPAPLHERQRLETLACPGQVRHAGLDALSPVRQGRRRRCRPPVPCAAAPASAPRPRTPRLDRTRARPPRP